MAFLEKVKPHLLSDDIFVQKTVLHALHDYPAVPEEWTVDLLKEAFTKEDKQAYIFIYLDHQKINESALTILLEQIPSMNKENIHLALKLINEVEPALALKYREQLKGYITSETWSSYELVVNGTKKEVSGRYKQVVEKLEQSDAFQGNLYHEAKRLAKCIVQKGWITEKEIDKTLSQELEANWFSYNGYLTVYMIGLLGNEKYIAILSSLLTRDEDILLEEVADALIQFQSDKVVKEVAPYVTDPDSIIFAASILENIKTDLSAQVLKEAYYQVEEIDEKELIIEALCHQFTEVAFPVVNEHMQHPYETSSLVDIEEVVYSFYTIMGESHPDLSLWKQEAMRIEMGDPNGMLAVQKPDKKVGRNDPCPCGSGKKYKKCCGK